jgi:formate-dependent nitrite reductase membrane component NrfD
VVPDAEFTSYYGRPVVKRPLWNGVEVAGYLFLGGLSGASAMLAAGAHVTGRNELATRAKLVAAGAIGVSAAALIHDLGRPARFANMLRMFKPSSPMSIGSWTLAGYGPVIGVAAATATLGRFHRVGALATAVSAALGPLVCTYTAALLADTAVPAWHDGWRELPFIFAGSSAAAAGGAGLLLAPMSQNGPARRLAVTGAVVELVVAPRMQQQLGMVSEPYGQGTAGRYTGAALVFTVGGIALAVAGRRSRALSGVAGAALVAGSAFTRFGIFHAGLQSADDPKYTVVPQRARRGATR